MGGADVLNEQNGSVRVELHLNGDVFDVKIALI